MIIRGMTRGSVEARAEVVTVWAVRRVRCWIDLRSETRRICWWCECKMGETERTKDGRRNF